MATINHKALINILIILLAIGIAILSYTLGHLTSPQKIVNVPVEVEVEKVRTIKIPVEIVKEHFPTLDGVDYFDVPLSKNLQSYITELCEEEDIPPAFIIAMIDVESGFNPDIYSATKDIGLMQINEINAEDLEEKYNVSNLYDPYQNVYCGIKIISRLIHKYENYHKALMAYNMGEGGAKRIWGTGVYESKYSKKIMDRYEDYKNEVE